jgi:penicillin-binding protein 2
MTPLGQNSPGRDLKVRYLYVGGLMLLGLLVLSIRLYRLQITRGDEYAAKSVANFVKEIRIEADRGMILDANRRILVDSRPSFDVFITPAFCENCSKEVLPRLASWLGWTPEEISEVESTVTRARRSAPYRPVAVRVDVSREQADVLDAHRTELPGVEVLPTPHRNYRTGTLLSHSLGYMNEITQDELERLNAQGGNYVPGDYIGRRGIEKAFEKWLRGIDGERKQVVDARGQPIPGLNELVGGGQITDPVAGNNVVLSIDMRLQEAIKEAFPGQTGAIVAVDTRTGFILAMHSEPGFDPNLLTGRITGQQLADIAKDPFKPMMNRNVAMHYSPGSTFKVVTTLAALREKVLSPHSQVFCGGGYRFGGRTWRCHKDAGHGYQDGTEALKHSCDVWFYRGAELMGIDAIAREAKELGFGKETGIGALLEVPGIMPDTAWWNARSGYNKGEALNTSIGQGAVNVTPLQLAMAYAAIANGGNLYRPQLVKQIESADGRVLQAFEPEVVQKVDMPPEHRKVVVDALVSVVNEPGGTAYRRRLKDVVVAGKTGTAQVAKLGRVRVKTEQMDYFLRDHAWFAAFAPAENPEIAIVVLNEHGGHGGSDAAPTAMAVLQKYFDLKKEPLATSTGGGG